MSLQSVIHTFLGSGDTGCKTCSVLKTVVVDPETCEPISNAGGSTDIQPILDCLVEIKDLLASIDAKLC